MTWSSGEETGLEIARLWVRISVQRAGLSVRVFVCLPVLTLTLSLCAYLCVCVSLCVSSMCLCLSVCLSVSLPLCVCVWLSVYRSICLSLSLSLSLFFVCLSVSLSPSLCVLSFGSDEQPSLRTCITCLCALNIQRQRKAVRLYRKFSTTQIL